MGPPRFRAQRPDFTSIVNCALKATISNPILYQKWDYRCHSQWSSSHLSVYVTEAAHAPTTNPPSKSLRSFSLFISIRKICISGTCSAFLYLLPHLCGSSFIRYSIHLFRSVPYCHLFISVHHKNKKMSENHLELYTVAWPWHSALM